MQLLCDFAQLEDMEGYNPYNHESTTGNDPESSKETNTKKKKRLGESITRHEASPEQVDDKKETVVEKSKAMWERLLSSDEKTETEKSVETPAEVAETAENDEVVETAIETLSQEEAVEAELFLTEGRLEELYAGQGQDGNPEDAAVRQASIDYLESKRHELIDALPPSDESESFEGDEPAADAEADLPDDPTEIEEDTAIPLGGSSTPPQPPRGGASSGAGATPPTPPRTPRTPPRHGTPPHGPAGPGFRSAPNFNFAPKQEAYQPDYRSNPNATYLLVGGLVGYFIGRRRGRIKTEKRMKVVQEKLEKQIEAKQREIVSKEMDIQRQTRENYRLRFENARQESAAAEVQLAPKQERVAEIRRQSSPEKAPVAEKILAANPERAPRQAEFSDKELLTISERVKVGETNLKQIYEAKLVTESGLRRLVNEHMAGNDVRRALAREFLAKELSYERDPRLRDSDAMEQSTAPEAAGLVPTIVQTQHMEPQSGPMPTSTTQSPQVNPSKPSTTPVSTGILIALTILAVGLAIYAVVLGLSR